MELSDIIAIINSSSKSESPWKMFLWIFTSARVYPLAVNSIFQFFMVFAMNFMTLSNILYIFGLSIILVRKTISLAFLLSIHDMATFSCLDLTRLMIS